jgi:hypothetical protein
LGEDVEAVALVDAEVVFGVVEGGSGETSGRRVSGRRRHDDRSGSLIRWVRESREEEEALGGLKVARLEGLGGENKDNAEERREEKKGTMNRAPTRARRITVSCYDYARS